MISKTLENLSKHEDEIQSSVHSLSGTMEQKFESLKTAGVFRQYAEIFTSLISLASDSQPNLEALKRATFLAWYEVVEPPCFSGCAELPGDCRLIVVGLIEPLVSELDIEFRWMLAHYYLIADYAFPELAKHPSLREFLITAESDGWKKPGACAESMIDRGLMGDYWKSILNSHAH